jgi:Pvc16 N-terminal domain
MIDEVDRRLKDWIGTVLDGVEVTLGSPSAEKPAKCVNLFLYQLVHDPPARTAAPPPLQLSLRYLITTWSDQFEESHRMLGELVFAAMGNREFQLELEPLAAEVWSALKAEPQPSFIVRIPVRQERELPKAKRVRAPLVVDSAPIGPFHGIVLGPGDIPLANARVDLIGLNLITQTDLKGRFKFLGVPGDEKPKNLVIKARGVAMSLNALERHSSPDNPLVIHFNLPEE